MEYEVIHEIPNSCCNNQLRDIFFEEVECDDPVNYVKSKFPKGEIVITTDVKSDTTMVVYAETMGLAHKFIFTLI